MQPRLALHKEHQQNKIEITTQLSILSILLYAPNFLNLFLQLLQKQSHHNSQCNATHQNKTQFIVDIIMVDVAVAYLNFHIAAMLHLLAVISKRK